MVTQALSCISNLTITSLPAHSRFVLICASGELLGQRIGYKLLICSDVLTHHYCSAINLCVSVCVCVLNPVLIVNWRWLFTSPVKLSRASLFYSLLLSSLRNLHSSSLLPPPTAAQSLAGLFVSGFSLSILPRLSLGLCVILANQWRGRNTMIAFRPNSPPPPPVLVLSVSEWRGEIYGTGAMLMRISFLLNSLPVKGIRTNTRKRQALPISL